MNQSKILKKLQMLKAEVTEKIAEIEEGLTERIEEVVETNSPRARNQRFDNPSLKDCEKQIEGKKPEHVFIKNKRFIVNSNTELLVLLFDTVWEIDSKKLPLLLDAWKNFFSTNYDIKHGFTKKLKCGLYTRNDTETHYVLYICIHTWHDIYCLPINDFSIHYVAK